MSSEYANYTQTLTERFDVVKQRVREDCGLTDIAYHSWIEPLSFLTFKDSTVFLRIPNDNTVQLNYLRTHYIDFFRVVISEELKENVEVEFLLLRDSMELMGEVPGAQVPANEPMPQTQARPLGIVSLNDKYRFDTFVVGSNNNFAYSAALAVAESPGRVYNPLFLYGGPGLGKTHLMHSIGHYIAESAPEKKILYVTSEKFTNEVIEAIRAGRQDSKVMTRLREKYRTVDVLLLDDVQFVIGKESTQEEFFHTFNELHQSGKQIVLSSDRSPWQMETLDERFRSRFEMGLSADIQAPDYETRMAILKKLGEGYPVFIEDAAYAFIAENIKSNIRELEGAFNKIIAQYRLRNLKTVTQEDAREILKDFLHPDFNRVITVKKVLETVCEHFGLHPQDLIGESRRKEIAFPRQVVMYLSRKYVSNISYDEIGTVLGGRDHTTIMHGDKKIEDSLKTDAELARTVDILVKKLNPSL